MSVQADEHPSEGDDEERGVPVPPRDVLHAKCDTYQYVARLFCGHVVSGEIRCPEVLAMGTHGAQCPEHGHFSLFEDLVSTAPLRDKWGRA